MSQEGLEQCLGMTNRETHSDRPLLEAQYLTFYFPNFANFQSGFIIFAKYLMRAPLSSVCFY
jgi:hypothetical protein